MPLAPGRAVCPRNPQTYTVCAEVVVEGNWRERREEVLGQDRSDAATPPGVRGMTSHVEPDESARSIGARAVSAGMWSAFESWGSKAAATVVFVVLARLLAPEDFGLVALGLVVVTLAQTLVKAGLAEAVVQRKDLTVDHVRASFWTSSLLGLTLAAIVFFAAPAIGSVFSEPKLTPLVRVLSLNFVLFGLSAASQALLQRKLEFRAIAMRSVLGSLVGGAAGIGAALAGWGAWALVTQNLVDQSIAAVILLVAEPPDLRGRPRWRAVRDLLGFSIRSLGIQLNNFAFRRSDDLIVGWRLGSTQLGFYSVAYRLMRLIDDMVAKVLLNVAFPTFAKVQGDKARSATMLRDASRIAAAALCPVFVGMSICAPEIISVAFGPDWAESVTPMRILALVGMLQGIQHFSASVLKANGRMQLLLRWSFATTIISVAGFFFAAPHGITVVALVYAATGYALSPFLPVMAHRMLDADVRHWFNGLVPVFGATLSMAGAVALLRVPLADTPDVIVLIADVTLGAVVYSVALHRLSPDLVARTKALLPERAARLLTLRGSEASTA